MANFQMRSQLEAKLATLEAAYKAQGRKERPYSKLAKARRRLAAAQRRQARIPQHLQKAEQAIATHRSRLDRLQMERTELKAYLKQLRKDNESNPEPVPIILRLDAGFGLGPNLTWLIEMGYIIYTNAFSANVATRLRDQVKPGDRWTRVGKNADMIAWNAQSINSCPYPLTIALERFHTPKEQKHSALIVYRDDGSNSPCLLGSTSITVAKQSRRASRRPMSCSRCTRSRCAPKGASLRRNTLFSLLPTLFVLVECGCKSGYSAVTPSSMRP